ncbi:hypothetical protein MRB53_040045 [Persea americana]|nr:hypothetical protein MRB53_040045 [Persea americana]
MISKHESTEKSILEPSNASNHLSGMAISQFSFSTGRLSGTAIVECTLAYCPSTLFNIPSHKNFYTVPLVLSISTPHNHNSSKRHLKTSRLRLAQYRHP